MSKNIEFYLKILTLLKTGVYYPSKIAEKLGVYRQKLTPYIKTLKKYDVIEQLSVGVWKVNNNKIESFIKQFLEQGKVFVQEHDNKNYPADTVRAHGFNFTITLPKKLDKYSIKKVLETNKLLCEGTGSATWKGYKTRISGWTVSFTPKSVLAWFPKTKSIYSERAKDAFLESLYLLREQVIKPLERLLGMSFKVRTRKGLQGYNFRTSKEHYALIKNVDAKQLRLDEQKLFVYDEDGKLWLIADFSLGEDETETVKTGEAVDDNDKMLDHYNSIKRTGMTYDKVLDGFEKTSEQLNSLVEDRKVLAGQLKFYGENAESHVGLIKTLGIETKNMGFAVNELTKVVKQLVPENNLLDFLQNNIHSLKDLGEYGEKIRKLSHEDKESFESWLFKKFSGV